MTQRDLDPSASRWVVQALGRLSASAAILIGFAIVLGGEIRFSDPSYAAALTYPGAPESWGVFIGIAGLVGLGGSLTGRMTVTRWSLYAIAAWSLFFGMSIVQSAFENPTGGLTGPFIYLHYAVISIVLGVAHQRMKEPSHHEPVPH